jgi:uncharacterized protein
MDPLQALAIFLLAASAAVVQSLTGLGFGLIIVPPLVMVLGAKDAVVVSNVLGTVLSGVMLTRIHARVEWRMNIVLLISAVVGMPLGLAILILIDPDLLQVIIACTVIVFTILLARGMRIHSAGLAGDAISGLLSGILRMSTSMSGPPVVIYLQGRGLTSDRFRATLAAFFVCSGCISIVLFAVSGQFSRKIGLELLPGLPALLLGLTIGGALYRRIDEVRFRRAVLAVLFISAGLAIVGVLL